MEISAIKEVVKFMLENCPETRENDNLLIVKIWWRHLGKDKIESMSAQQFMMVFRNGGLPNAISIVRARRKLQLLNENLRGENYDGNQREQEKVKDQLKNFAA